MVRAWAPPVAATVGEAEGLAGQEEPRALPMQALELPSGLGLPPAAPGRGTSFPAAYREGDDGGKGSHAERFGMTRLR
jgi:hypothetical protein